MILKDDIVKLETALTSTRGPDFVSELYRKNKIDKNNPNFTHLLSRLGALTSACVDIATKAPAGSARPAPGAAAGASTSPVPLGALRVLATHVLGAGCVSDNATREQLDAAFFAAGCTYPGANFCAIEARCGPAKKFGGLARTLRSSQQAKIDAFCRRWNQQD
mgnify:CR=1 FL=1